MFQARSIVTRPATIWVALAGVGMGSAVSSEVGAAEATDRQNYPLTAESWPCEVEIEVAPFDDRDGRYRLQSVEIQVEGHLSADVAAENDAAAPAPTFIVALSGFVAARIGDVLAFRPFSRIHLAPGRAASDGVPGEGQDFWDFGTLTVAPTAGVVTTAFPASLTGNDPVAALVVVDGEYHVYGTPLSTLSVSNQLIGGQLIVVYSYDTECAADIDRGGTVGLTDLLAVLSTWGQCADTPADVDLDGCVGFSDLLAVLDGWGLVCGDGV